MINTEKNIPVFNYYPPKGKFIGIVSIPHSGESLPNEFRTYLTDNTKDLMQDVDYRVQELVDINALQQEGIAVIYSNIIRTAIDLNRERSQCVFNWKNNSKGNQIVLTEPEHSLIDLWTEKYYSPYYEMLKTMILELQQKQSIASFVDLHSMPGKAEEYHLKMNPNQDIIRPDFCISDVHGKSCTPDFIQYITNALGKSYNTQINNPYIGGNITKFLDKTYSSLNNIQIEISRSLYMNEDNKKLKENSALKKILTSELINLFKHFHD